MRRNGFKLLYKKLVKLLKLYTTPNIRLTGRQRLRKLRVDRLLSFILLVLLIILALQCAHIYHKVHRSIHIENVTFVRTGYTSLSCYYNYRGTILCCANNPYLITSFINSSKNSVETFECYKFQKIK
jgi:hypothetical protein